MRTSQIVTIIDYNRGNIFSIENAIKHVGGNCRVSGDPIEISNADKLILPGVGAFGDAMAELQKFHLVEAIYEFIKRGKHILGICLGMQLLFSESYEFGHYQGLDLIKGKVIRFNEPKDDDNKFKIPHIAWCPIKSPELGTGSDRNSDWNHSILQRIVSGTYFYFVHSYICVPENEENVLAESYYGYNRFCSVVRYYNVWGCQFHPEKSGINGLKIYEDFIHNID